MALSAYSVRVDADLDPQISRWTWLVKWILAIPDYIVRAFLWVGAPMTEGYPPFQLEMAAHEPGGTPSFPASDASTAWGSAASAVPPQQRGRRGWTGGRITALVVGSVLALISLGVLAGGGAATWADNTQRDSAGYLTTGTHSFTTTSYALTSGRIELGDGQNVFALSGVLGTVRLRVTPIQPNSSVFVGIGPSSAVNVYLSGVSHEQVKNWAGGTTTHQTTGGAPAGAPTSKDFWTVHVSGSGTQTLTWKPASGNWTVVVMNPNAAPGVRVAADVGATTPDLGWIAAGLLAVGALLLIGGIALIVIPISRASR